MRWKTIPAASQNISQFRSWIRILVGIAMLFLSAIEPVVAKTISVAGTKHDLSIYEDIVGASGPCEVCHGSNGDSGVQLVLLNRSNPVSKFQLYSSATMDALVNEPGISSLVCLSCHDGVTPLDSLTGTKGTENNNMNTHFTGSPAIIGTDLRNDHPVGVDVRSDFGGIRDEVTIRNAGLRLYDGKVECSTCHDPHGSEGYPFFLRTDPAGPPICLFCHIK